VTNQFASRQFVMFLVTGGCAAAVNFLSRIVYSGFMSFSNAVVCAYLTGMVTAFVLAKLFVFKTSEHSLGKSMFLFSVVNLLAIAQTWGVSMALALYALPALGISRFSAEIAHAVGVMVPVFTSYLGHKRWSFR
jgi:putative flippase GtrA